MRMRFLPALAASLAFIATSAGVRAEDAPGLVGEYFQMSDLGNFPSIPAERKPTLVRIDKQVNFQSTEGDMSGSRLTDNYYVRWSGVVRIATAGDYVFTTESDDGSRLWVDGKQVIDNGGLHGMEKKSGTVTLAAGDHPIKLDYFEGSGGAGVRLLWTPPGKGEDAIPGSVLFHAKESADIAWDKAAWEKLKKASGGGGGDARFANTDFGPFLSSTVKAAGDNVANKGIIIRLGKVGEDGAEHNMLFDTDLLRYAAGWSGGFINFTGVAYNGAHGPNPTPAGDELFATRPGPGWAKAGAFSDPRANGFGPLPADWAKYKGLYRSGDKVVLSYTVAGADVLDLPGLRSADGQSALVRTLRIAKSAGPLTLLVCEEDGATAGIAPLGKAHAAGGAGDAAKDAAVLATGDTLVAAAAPSAPAGATWAVDGKRILLTIPAQSAPAQFDLVLWRGAAAGLPAAGALLSAKSTVPDLTTLTKGGPSRWKETLETKGSLGTGDGPYVVDTVTVPESNPWNSSLRFGGLDFFSDGRAALSTWNGDVWVVSGIDDKLEKVTWKRFASGLHQALGLKIVDDVVYTLGRDQITRLKDLDNDGEADFYENFNNDVQVTPGFHEFALDLHTDRAGNFYFAKGGPVRPGGRGWETISDHAGCILKVSKDGSKLEVYGTGVRAPNGMCVGPNDEVTVGDNQGTWTPVCRLSLVKPGEFVGVPDLSHVTPPPTSFLPPIVWLPMYVDNSSGAQVWVPKGDKWGPLGGQLLHQSYGQCQLYNVLTEVVDGQIQGGVVNFGLGFNTGAMRARFSAKDGQLYVSGMKGWQTSGAKDGGLQRVRFTGKPLNMPIGMAVKKKGVVLTFATALDKATAGDKANYTVDRWNYTWTSAYGSDEYKISDPKAKGHDPLEVTAATVAADGLSVFLEIPDIAPVMQQRIKYKIALADGTALKQEVVHTIHKLGD